MPDGDRDGVVVRIEVQRFPVVVDKRVGTGKLVGRLAEGDQHLDARSTARV